MLSITSFELIGHYCFSGYAESGLVFRSSGCSHRCLCWWIWSFTGRGLDRIQCPGSPVHPETEISRHQRNLQTVGFIFRPDYSESGLPLQGPVQRGEINPAIGILTSNILLAWQTCPTSSVGDEVKRGPQNLSGWVLQRVAAAFDTSGLYYLYVRIHDCVPRNWSFLDTQITAYMQQTTITQWSLQGCGNTPTTARHMT